MILPTTLRLRTAGFAVALVSTATALAGTAASDAPRDVIVVSRLGMADALASVAEVGGTVLHELAIVDGVAARVTTTAATLLDADEDLGVVADARVQHQGRKPKQDTDTTTSVARDTAAATVGARDLWRAGNRGAGIGVALVDTGVAAHPALRDRVVATYDVAGSGPGDGFGHGTFMAGLIVGESAGGPALGAAPDADLIDVKVAAADGSTWLSDVLAGLDLVQRRADEHGIRVVAVALARPRSPGTDLLELASERLWYDGIVVVAAAGNDGEVTSPGSDAVILTVGALDDNGSSRRRDDIGQSWSGHGRVDGIDKPDLVAPGVSLISLRATGSAADEAFPEARHGDAYFVGSGSSMATAVAAGAVATLLDARPDLTPNQVKSILKLSAYGLAADAEFGGAGGLDLAAAASQWAGSSGQLVDGVNGLVPGVSDLLGALALGDDEHWAGRSWAGRSWAGRSWAGRSWAGSTWG